MLQPYEQAKEAILYEEKRNFLSSHKYPEEPRWLRV
jgi:hypothetical protein